MSDIEDQKYIEIKRISKIKNLKERFELNSISKRKRKSIYQMHTDHVKVLTLIAVQKFECMSAEDNSCQALDFIESKIMYKIRLPQ